MTIAAAQSAWTTAAAAASCLLFALGPRGYSAITTVAFPAGLSTGILVFTTAALLMGEIAGFYVTLWWWDVVLHLVSSAALSVVGMALALMAVGAALPRIAARMLAILALGFAMMIGALWELMEFTLDATLGTVTQRSGLPDTMSDIAINFIGGLLGALAAHAHVTRAARWPLTGMLGRFIALNPDLYPLRPHGQPVRR